MRKFFVCSLTLLVLAFMFAANAAFGDLVNVRPVSLGSSSLQSIFNDMYVNAGSIGPGIDAVGDQVDNAIFTRSSSTTSTATMIIELAGFAGSNKFGIYKYGDPSSKAEVFAGGAAQGYYASIGFISNGNVSITVNDSGGLFVSNTVTTGFGDIFGFYLDVSDYTVFSEDSLNVNGNAQALMYRGDDQTYLQLPSASSGGKFQSGEFIIAFEDLRPGDSGYDYDYNDMVVMVQSIDPVVPEPTTLLLLGSG